MISRVGRVKFPLPLPSIITAQRRGGERGAARRRAVELDRNGRNSKEVKREITGELGKIGKNFISL